MSKSVTKKVTSESRKKALFGNFKRCTSKGIHPHIKFVMSEEDIHVWYFVMGVMVDSDGTGEFSGNTNEFLKGQFFGKITATKMYPYSPPDVIMLTPTNIFPLNNDDFCIDIGKYHKDNYSAMLGMDGYAKMVWSGLIGWRELGAGINLLSASKCPREHVKKIRQASIESQAYNKKYNSHIITMFQDLYKNV